MALRLRGIGCGALILVLVIVLGVVTWNFRGSVINMLRPDRCTVTVDDHTVTLELEQAQNAGIIAGVGVGRGLPARAVSIALATAYQESKLSNIDYGDRDSLGLFQQRPSQGWGTEEQVMDPVYATNAFYDELVKLDGYREMDINDAAQAVQRSGHPDGYREHEENARALASALTGHHQGVFSCEVSSDPDRAADRLTDSGLVRRAEAVRTDLLEIYGELPMGGFAPGGVREGHMEGSAHYDGRAVDIFFRPINPANKVAGWSVAQYLVSQAERMDIRTVIYDDRIWTHRRSGEGWRDYQPQSRSGDQAVLEHRDHVHVDVFD